MKIRSVNLLFSRRSWLSITNKNISKISFDQPIRVVKNLFDYVIFFNESFGPFLLPQSNFFYINVIKSMIGNFIK